MRVAIYSAIFGGYDLLKDQPSFDDTDYLMFSDTPLPRSRSWRVIPCRKVAEHPRLSAKRLKTMPHRFIPPEYDYTIWIDGSMVITGSDFVTRCISALMRFGIGCMLHPVGRCIYQEAAGCCHMTKYAGLPIMEQAAHYRAQGYPENNGLAACGIVVRDMHSPATREKTAAIGDAWMQENLNWTYQDQISFPYVLWKHQYWFDVLPIDYRDRSSFVLCDHRSER